MAVDKNEGRAARRSVDRHFEHDIIPANMLAPKRRTKRWSRKEKLRIALAVGSAVSILLAYVCKDVLVGELNELSASIQTAQANADKQRSETMISMEVMRMQEQMALYQAKNIQASQDYSALILQNSQLAREALGNLNADFESTSQLIDKLSFGDVKGDLRRMRDEERAHIDKTNREVNEALQPSSKNDLARLTSVTVALIKPLVNAITLAVLEGFAKTTAQQLQDLIGMIRRSLVDLGHAFYFIGAGLAIGAILYGGKEAEVK